MKVFFFKKILFDCYHRSLIDFHLGSLFVIDNQYFNATAMLPMSRGAFLNKISTKFASPLYSELQREAIAFQV